MGRAKDETPSVATFSDHEVITPPHRLRRVLVAASEGDDDPVARAEAALSQLEGEFGSWMAAECERLEAARQQLVAQGFDQKTRDALFHAAHDIRGEAATFGFPGAAGVADSLCRLIEHTPDLTRIPLTLVEQHVDAVRAIVREYERNDAAELARALTLRLREVTDEFLAHENRDRPDYLDSILGPPLSPGEQAG